MARLTKEQIHKIRALRNKSVSYRSIAITMGISIGTVKSHCRRHGLTPIQILTASAEKREDPVRSSRDRERRKPDLPEPVCEVSVSYSSHDTDALPFLLETLASVFSGR